MESLKFRSIVKETSTSYVSRPIDYSIYDDIGVFNKIYCPAVSITSESNLCVVSTQNIPPLSPIFQKRTNDPLNSKKLSPISSPQVPFDYVLTLKERKHSLEKIINEKAASLFDNVSMSHEQSCPTNDLYKSSVQLFKGSVGLLETNLNNVDYRTTCSLIVSSGSSTSTLKVNNRDVEGVNQLLIEESPNNESDNEAEIVLKDHFNEKTITTDDLQGENSATKREDDEMIIDECH